MKALITFMLICLTALAKGQHKNPKINLKDTTIYTAVERQPQLGADEGALGKYLGKKVHYVVADTIGHSFVGTFLASFIVEKDGTLSHIKILKPAWDSATGRLFIKALRESPKWQPGIQNGYIVRVQFSVPISINVAFD
jgi:protein TonB